MPLPQLSQLLSFVVLTKKLVSVGVDRKPVSKPQVQLLVVVTFLPQELDVVPEVFAVKFHVCFG